MLKVNVWDEIGCEWSERELDLPHTCRDATLINEALDAANTEDETEEETESEWEIEKVTDTGNLLVIETRSSRNHQAIIIVNACDQDEPA